MGIWIHIYCSKKSECFSNVFCNLQASTVSLLTYIAWCEHLALLSILLLPAGKHLFTHRKVLIRMTARDNFMKSFLSYIMLMQILLTCNHLAWILLAVVSTNCSSGFWEFAFTTTNTDSKTQSCAKLLFEADTTKGKGYTVRLSPHWHQLCALTLQFEKF